MISQLKVYLIFCFCLSILLVGCGETKDRPLVNDNVNLMSLEEQNILNRELIEYKKETSNEVMVYIIASLKGANIASHALKLHNALEVGSKRLGNGVLIFYASNDKQIRISVGYGLEKTLTNEICQKIIDDNIAPNFREGQYLKGFQAALIQIEKYANSEYHN